MILFIVIELVEISTILLTKQNNPFETAYIYIYIYIYTHTHTPQCTCVAVFLQYPVGAWLSVLVLCHVMSQILQLITGVCHDWNIGDGF